LRKPTPILIHLLRAHYLDAKDGLKVRYILPKLLFYASANRRTMQILKNAATIESNSSASKEISPKDERKMNELTEGKKE